MALKIARLRCVSSENNNKFYNMTQLDDDWFLAEWGRIGNDKVSSKKYPMSDWESTLYKKTHKPGSQESYVDKTELETICKTVDKSFDVKDKTVKELIEFLMKAANKSISDSYVSPVGSVTKLQIEAAQEILDKLSQVALKKIFTNEEADELLLTLYQTIPRKMKNTKYYLLKFADQSNRVEFFNALLQNEQNLLSTLSTQTVVSSVKTDTITLESLGFDVEVASQADRDRISKETDFKVGSQKIFKVTNKDTEKVFRKDIKTKLLYHGSRNENWISILMNGLKIRPKGVVTTGSMFGNGIYAANKAAKSIGYTSLRGSYWASGSANKAYLAIFEFATGKEWQVIDSTHKYDYSMQSLDLHKVKAKGCDSVYAKGGADLRNDEFIVYESNQCTIRYLIELSE